MAVTVDATVAGLNQFDVQRSNVIQTKLRQGLEWEQRLTPRVCQKTYSAPNATPTELVQAYQWQFTPKGNVAMSAVENTLSPIKVDILLTADDLEVFWDTYMVEWFEIGLDPIEWSFARYMYDNVYLPKILEEMNQNAWSGDYLAPTAGTAGLSVNSVDGYRKKIAAAITAGSLTAYSTGAWVDNTLVSQMEAWVESLPAPYRDAPGDIYMSHTLAKRYWNDYRNKFGTGNGVGNNANEDLRIDMTQKRIVPINSMAGSNRIMFSPATTRNFIWGTRTGKPTYFNIRWMQQDVRVLKGTAEIYRFYGWEFWDHLYVNDQV